MTEPTITPETIPPLDAETLAPWLAGLECDCWCHSQPKKLHAVAPCLHGPCDQCSGTVLALPGLTRDCRTCEGTGVWYSDYGQYSVKYSCRDCGGDGKRLSDHPDTVRGTGRVPLQGAELLVAVEAVLERLPRVWWSYHHQATGTNYYTLTMGINGRWETQDIWCIPDRATAVLRTLALAWLAKHGPEASTAPIAAPPGTSGTSGT